MDVIGIFQDLRVGLRSIRRRPGFFAAAVLTLALGLGAATAIFAVVQAALLRPLPFKEPARLRMVWGVAGPDRDVRGASPVEIDDWRRLTRSFESLSIYDRTTLNLSGDQAAQQLPAEIVSPGYLSLLGVTPTLGRGLRPEDDQPGAIGGAVISDALWKSRFGGDARVLGRSITLDDVPFTIVGVAPPGFRGLAFDAQIWAPLGPFVTPEALRARGSRWLGAVGRLRPGVTDAGVQADMDAATATLERLYPDANRRRGALVIGVKAYQLDRARQLLLALLAGVGLLLLIACANVANLQLVRTRDRRHELALRHALGASRGRVARQLITESVALSILGCAAGVFLAWIALGLLLPLVPPTALPLYAHVRLDPVVVATSVVTAVVAGVFVGTLPAWRADADVRQLRAVNATPGGWRKGRISLQQVLVAGQIALALVLLMSAGLAIRSMREQLAIDPGFRATGVLSATVSLTGDRYDAAARRRYAASLIDELRGLPGVADEGVGSDAPLRDGYSASILRRAGHPDDHIRYYRHAVSPSYFRTLGIPILRGRAFDAGDRSGAPGVAVISAAFAARLFPGVDPLGKHLVIGNDTATIVGIAGNVHFRDLTTDLMDPADDPDLYFSAAQVTPRTFTVLVRSAGDPALLAGSIRRAAASLDAAVPAYGIQPLERALAAQTALARLMSFLLGLFGTLSLLLAAVGLYGVTAYVVRGRQREMAVRLAIGARPAEVRRLVLRQSATVIVAGLIIGGAAALLTGRVLASLLYGVPAADPVILTATAGTLAAAALLATWVPASQASRVEPRSTLAE
ncbi:MAG: ABC transporter permease [Gemmatimonadota bacterium]